MSNEMPKITPEIYEAFKTAVEIGKWPDGRVLTDEQKETCMSVVISYEVEHVAETSRTGYIDKGHKDGDVCDDDTQIIKLK